MMFRDGPEAPRGQRETAGSSQLLSRVVMPARPMVRGAKEAPWGGGSSE